MYVIPHPFIRKAVVCVILRGVFDVARCFKMAEQVLRLMRREARVASIGFTLFYARRFGYQPFPMRIFRVKCLIGA